MKTSAVVAALFSLLIMCSMAMAEETFDIQEVCGGPVIVRAVHVHEWQSWREALLVFAFIDSDCDGAEDVVFVYRHIGRLGGEHCFEKLDEISPGQAEVAIEDWTQKRKANGKAC